MAGLVWCGELQHIVARVSEQNDGARTLASVFIFEIQRDAAFHPPYYVLRLQQAKSYAHSVKQEGPQLGNSPIFTKFPMLGIAVLVKTEMARLSFPVIIRLKVV